MNFYLLVSEWDKQIRQGQGGSLVETVQGLHASDVPQALRPQVAAIARRLGLFKTGLDILREDYLAVRERGGNEAVLSEYAALLTEIGSVRISERIFARFPQPQLPSTHFYSALMWIKQWEHEKAAVQLRQFKNLASDQYWRAIADLNLAGCLIFSREWEEAGQILEGLERIKEQLSPMANGVLSELKGQFLFFSGRREEARNHFEHSFNELKQTHNPSLMFAEKWMLISDLLQKPWSEIEGRFKAFQTRVRETGYWEILRELDRFLALRFSDQATLNKLYFGSAAEGYRKMICRDLNWQPPAEYFHLLSGQSATAYFDAQTLELRTGDKLVRLPQVSAQLLKALATDLYKPMAVGSLFEQIYHGQHFDPSFAAQRVHQAISRFRKFAEGLPLEVKAADLGFILEAQGDFAIRYEPRQDAASAPVLKLRQSFGLKEFTAAQVADAYGLSKRTANRMLTEQLQAGELVKSGAGKTIKYKLKSAA